VDSFDSRALRIGDAFGQVFAKAGSITYRLTLPGGVPVGGGEDLLIEVQKSTAGRVQHFVKVFFDEGNLLADPRRLIIGTGDVVLWSPVDSKVPAFRVVGSYQTGEVIDSGNPKTDAFYSHVFGLPGKYEWHDANGSGAKGDLAVSAARLTTPTDFEEYHALLRNRSLAEKNVFHIKGSTVTPSSLSLKVGQTVFWVIEATKGVAVVSGSDATERLQGNVMSREDYPVS